ncbi:MAG: hypothetical protein WBZ37_12280 [Mycobacterium sp.]
MTGPVSQVNVGTNYKLILISVVTIFFVTLAAYLALAVFVHEPTDAVKQALGVLDFIVKSTLGGILGLLGAKVP